MKAINLKTEYLNNPLGIDIINPRLTWNCEGDIKQNAYRIEIIDGNTSFISDKIISNKMSYNFTRTISSRQEIKWRVQLWNEKDQLGEWSNWANFEVGLLSFSDWKAKWITGNYQIKRNNRYPVDYFKKEFETNKFIKARLYITACGVYEAYINNQRVGNFIMAPGHVDYNKRIYYQTYDVTNLIKIGQNKINVLLGDGWYRGSCGAWGITNQYGIETKILVQLELIDEKNNITYITSDETWNWSNDGPILFADNKDGERVDARLKPSYKQHAKVSKHKIIPSASNNVIVTEHETFTPEIIHTKNKNCILDFKQNIAGYISFKIKAKEGKKITLLFGEMLTKEGEFTQKNIQCSNKYKTSPLQKIEYICHDGINEYKTKFAIFGFQYVLIETDIELKKDNFTAIAVYSNLENTLSFDSSNSYLNKFIDCTRWSAKNNSLDVPTDCPTRERHGWTGDSQLFFTTASYLFNYAPFAKKHLNDIYDWQKKDGMLPQIAPYGGVDFYMNTLNGSVGWADAGILIPYRFSKIYNDRQILLDYYDKMKKYAEFMIKRIGKKTLLSKPLHIKRKYRKYLVNYGQSYGEWAEPADVFPNNWTDMVLPHPEVSTAYTAWMMKLMAEIAHNLNKIEDENKYLFYHNKIKEAYQVLRNKKEFNLDTNRQATLVRPLYLDLLNNEQTKYAQKRLIQSLENYNWRVGTGFLSTPLILYVLSDIDLNAAYRLLENEEMPGWFYMVKSGASTIWESWEGINAQNGIGSLDHYSKGAMCEWIFTTMCGINILNDNKILISPHPGGTFTYANLKYQSIYGEIKCSWIKNNNGWSYEISIPPNVTAEIKLLDGTQKILCAGTYKF